MDKHQIKAKILAHEEYLKASGIRHLTLFGSKARGDDTAKSDVDLLADYDRARRLTLFDKAGLEVELADVLMAPVDLCDREMLEGSVRLRAEREAVLVF
jgi:predicted nucleotidyltransferase